MTEVRVWEENVVIPTYGIGKAEKHPIFSEKRVYQGSSGKVYPYPVIEKIEDRKEDRTWKAVFLENRYLKVMILPELGGRIQRAYDKTNGYDFVYYNHVIKPALVGLTGPWISGGIEFNWPQHHRPTTFLPVDYALTEHEDGSKTVMVNDVDEMYGTKGIASITLYPDKAYIEIRGQLYNRTPLPQTFLWWANPAVPVNENTQSIFPPDVHAVMDHGKRDVSSFPIATGVYYKHDYSAGVDISRYKNIPVPTSYMAERSDFDFVGGYDYGREAGILHVADHHISPGKKQWTWGCGDFGKAWDRNLTDGDGPYVELMTGVYTDNQPDFTWLKPFEEKTFRQYFMPYKKVGAVKNATVDAMVNLEFADGKMRLLAYATGEQKDAKIQVLVKGQTYYEKTADLSPENPYEAAVDRPENAAKTDITLRVLDKNGRELVAFTPLKEEIPNLPHPAEAAKDPQEIQTCEELLLTGLHIEQYRHATYLPDDYYLEGLRRDSGDIRLNTAYGMLLLRRGLFAESEKYFRTALKRMTWKNPNPYTSEACYDLGLALFYQGRDQEAFDAFYKATWSNEQQEMAFFYLAVIAARFQRYQEALEFCDKGLVKNAHNIKARGLKAILLRKLGKVKEAQNFARENLGLDPFDYVSGFEQIRLDEMISEDADAGAGLKASDGQLGSGTSSDRNRHRAELKQKMRDFHQNYLLTAMDYMEAGFYEEALQVLDAIDQDRPMLWYYRAECLRLLGKGEEQREALNHADAADSYTCFPNRLEDISVLQHAIAARPELPKAYYYLGCLWYDKRQYELARENWEKSAEIDDTFSSTLRNLALVYYNKCKEPMKAKDALERAYALDEGDSRIFLELDQLYKKLGVPVERRLEFYDRHRETFLQRDDVTIEYITMLNQTGQHGKAYEMLLSRRFHPWEGGEGKATGQYETALTEMGRLALMEGKAEEAEKLLRKALIYPENLGEGRLEGTKDNHIYYYLGMAEKKLGRLKEAEEDFRIASVGTDEPAGVMFYNDQPADMILFQGLALEELGEHVHACSRFRKLISYGEKHLYDTMRMDYFAVSYPDLLIFEEDLSKKNEAHCCYLMGLGNLGLGNAEKAEQFLRKTLTFDPAHQKAALYLKRIH